MVAQGVAPPSLSNPIPTSICYKGHSMIKVKPITPNAILWYAFNSVPEFRVVKDHTINFYEHQRWTTSTKGDFKSFALSLRSDSTVIRCTTHSLRRSTLLIQSLARSIQKNSINIQSLHFPVSLQTLWLISHTTTLLGTSMYHYHITFKGYNIGYSLASLSAILTYSLILYRKLIALPHLTLSILNSENTHLLIMAFLTATSARNFLRLVSFSIYSFMNLTNHFAGGNQKLHLNPSLVTFEYPLLLAAAYSEMIMCTSELIDALLNRVSHKVIFYSIFISLRLASSEYFYSSFSGISWICMKTLNEIKSQYSKRSITSEIKGAEKSEIHRVEVMCPQKKILENSQIDDDFQYIFEVY
ncbi:hypothetical protein CLIB1423_07S01706 [[Candida] railenensis]|uniref:Uncharacterized protein n=1 Tax=[Candida] railenensis TaxID=45579 RepID=A0A9P0QPV5_9ASCO|nr:hypothetical protein CLIB1423_07S01706 [[Candida] railenensis]